MSITQQKKYRQGQLGQPTHHPWTIPTIPCLQKFTLKSETKQNVQRTRTPKRHLAPLIHQIRIGTMSNDQLHLATPKVCPWKWATDRLPFPMFRWFQGFKMISRKSAMWIVETGCVNLFMIHEWLEGQHGSLILFMGTRNCRDFSC